MLSNFRLISDADLQKLPTETPVIYALCFDVKGLLVKVGWTKHPASRLPALLREQAVEPSEIWIGEVDLDVINKEYASHDILGSFARRIHRLIDKARSRNEFFRLPMRSIDVAFTKAVDLPF